MEKQNISELSKEYLQLLLANDHDQNNQEYLKGD